MFLKKIALMLHSQSLHYIEIQLRRLISTKEIRDSITKKDTKASSWHFRVFRKKKTFFFFTSIMALEKSQKLFRCYRIFFSGSYFDGILRYLK